MVAIRHLPILMTALLADQAWGQDGNILLSDPGFNLNIGAADKIGVRDLGIIFQQPSSAPSLGGAFHDNQLEFQIDGIIAPDGMVLPPSSFPISPIPLPTIPTAPGTQPPISIGVDNSEGCPPRWCSLVEDPESFKSCNCEVTDDDD